MKKNFLDELLLLLGNNPEKYMIEHSLFFSKDVVDTAFNEMLNYLQTGHHFIIRKSTKNAVVSPYRDVAGTLFWNNIYGTKILNNIIVKLDYDGNREVRRLIKSLTSTTVSQGNTSDIMFGKISHIWGETSNPFFFTGLWNVVIVPAYCNDVLDKNTGTDPRIDNIIEQYKAVCWDRFDIKGKLSQLGLTPAEIRRYEPKQKMAHNYNIQEIPLFVRTRKGSTKPTASGTPKVQFSINGTPCQYCTHVLAEAMKIYVAKNTNLTPAQVAANWAPVQIVPNQVETDADHMVQRAKRLPTDSRYDNRSIEIKLPKGGSVFVSTQFTGARTQKLAQKINAQPWGVVIK